MSNPQFAVRKPGPCDVCGDPDGQTRRVWADLPRYCADCYRIGLERPEPAAPREWKQRPAGRITAEDRQRLGVS